MDALEQLSGGHPDDHRTAGYVVRGVDVNPQELTALTGLDPDQTWRVGDKLRSTSKPAHDSLWRINSGLSDTEEFHRHIAALLARMRPSWNAFVALGARYSPYIDVSIHLHEAQGPLVVLLPETMRDLSQLNARVVFDLYALPGQPD